MKQLYDENIEDHEKIVQEIKNKKEEAERLMKENSEKLHDMQSSMNKLVKENEDQKDAIEYKDNLVEELRSKIDDYKAQIGDFEKRIQQLEDKLSMEVTSKQEEIRELSKVEYDKYYS